MANIVWSKDPEIQAECDYRYDERLGMLAGEETPTSEQEQIARTEVREYLKSLREVKRDATPDLFRPV